MIAPCEFEADYTEGLWEVDNTPEIPEPSERKPAPEPWNMTATRMACNHNWCFRGDNTKPRNKK